jgi:hypothetical protein
MNETKPQISQITQIEETNDEPPMNADERQWKNLIGVYRRASAVPIFFS